VRKRPAAAHSAYAQGQEHGKGFLSVPLAVEGCAGASGCGHREVNGACTGGGIEGLKEQAVPLGSPEQENCTVAFGIEP
jgi:hypothetical protein